MLYSPALADPFESLNAHFHAARIVDAAPSVRLNGANRALIDLQSQLQAGQAKTVKKVVEPPDSSGASLVYAGYPYDPYAQARFTQAEIESHKQVVRVDTLQMMMNGKDLRTEQFQDFTFVFD